MPASNKPQIPCAQINRDQLERNARVRPSSYTVPIPVPFVTDDLDSVPEHFHHIPSRDVVDRQLPIVEGDLVFVRIEAAPVDHAPLF